MNDKPQPITSQPGIYGKVLPFLPQGPAAAILDVGAGEGFFSQLCWDKGYRNLTACDFDRGRWVCPQIPFHVADLSEKMPFEDASFDCTVCIEVIEHLENHALLVSEMARITRPGGTIVITTPNIISLSGRLHFLLYGYHDAQPIPLDPMDPELRMRHVNPITLQKLLYLLARSNCRLVDLTTNRYRKGALLALPFLYPIVSLALRRKLHKARRRGPADLFRTHQRSVLSLTGLLGRIVVAVARKDGSPDRVDGTAGA